MKLISRVFFILSILFIVRIFQSCCLTCCDCSEEVNFFDFEEISITNLDNVSERLFESKTDTMYSAALAFELKIFGNYEYAGLKTNIQGFGFQTAMAMEECHCPSLFKANQKITKITIKSLETFSPDYLAGSDVTELFLGVVNARKGYFLKQIFEPINNLYSELNPETFYIYKYSDNAPGTNIHVFCAENIMNDTAIFEFIVDFSDGKSFSLTTDLIHIKQSI